MLPRESRGQDVSGRLFIKRDRFEQHTTKTTRSIPNISIGIGQWNAYEGANTQSNQ